MTNLPQIKEHTTAQQWKRITYALAVVVAVVLFLLVKAWLTPVDDWKTKYHQLATEKQHIQAELQAISTQQEVTIASFNDSIQRYRDHLKAYRTTVDEFDQQKTKTRLRHEAMPIDPLYIECIDSLDAYRTRPAFNYKLPVY